MASREYRFRLNLLLICFAVALAYLLPSQMAELVTTAYADDDDSDDGQVVLPGLVRDFLSSHEDFDVEPEEGLGHYAGNVSQALGIDGAPLQVHGVTDFEITFGTLIPGEPYAARATVLGAEITSSGTPMPVTLRCETDAQIFEPFGGYLDPGGGTVNDDNNPRHFIFSLDEVYSAETPISVAATSWMPEFDTSNFGYETVFSTSSTACQHGQIATQVTLPEDGTVTSITAYVYNDDDDCHDDMIVTLGDLRYAIYSDDGNEPGDLVVESIEGEQDGGWGWHTMNIPDTWLPAGTYWLALSTDEGDEKFRYLSGSGGRTRSHSNNGEDDGFVATWGSSIDYWNTRKVSIYATYTTDVPHYESWISARSGDDSPYVKVLKDGSSVPDIPAFQDQTNLAVFVQPYVNVATGKIELQDNQAIYLFELGTTNLSSSAADFQDLVIMVTLATDPIYFMTDDVIAEGTRPIGFKVQEQWRDQWDRNIAPHLYQPSLDDQRGESGVTASGGVTSPVTFFEWFRDILGTNLATDYELTLTDDGSGVFEYHTNSFFPIDGLLYGNEGMWHNHFYTYALLTHFEYDQAADQFIEFRGGDGVWIFVGRKLVIDLGGVQNDKTQHIDLNRLGLVDGEICNLRIFYANRNVMSAEFHMRTNVFLRPGHLMGAVYGGFD